MTNNTAINAIDLAKLIDADFETNLEGIFEAAAKKAQGPLVMLAEMNRVFGDLLANFPVPDSPWNPQSNVVTDKYERSLKTDDGKKVIKGSWYADFYAATHRGAKVYQELDQISLAITKPEDVAKEYSDLKQLTKSQLEARRNVLRQKKTLGPTMIKKAVKIYQQMALVMQAASEGKLKATVEIMTDDNGEISRAPTPIVVYDPNKTTSTKVVSVGTFLSYDVDKAIRDGGTVQDLWGTAGSSSETGSNDTGPIATFDIKVANFKEYIVDGLNFMEGNGGINTAHLANAMKKWDEAAILSFGDFAAEITNLYNVVKDRYIAISAKKQNAA